MFCFVNIAAFSFAQTSNTLPATGNVGVGTLTPATKLEVVGNTALKGAVTVRDSVTIQKRLTVNQNIKIQGKSVFVNKARFKNNINVLGSAKLKNKLIVDSLAHFKSKLVVDGLTKMKGNAIINGNLKLPNLSTTNNLSFFLTSNVNGKIGGLSKLGLTTIIYQPPQTCRTDQNGNILSVWKQTPHPNYGILYTGTDCPTRVGIGIATPIATLDVNGNGYFSQTLEVGSNATPIAFPTQVKINAINRQAGLLLINRPIATSSIPLYGIKNIVNTNTINAYAVTQESTNQDVFVVKGDGSVGIGINNPTTPLDVDGQITMRVGAAAGFIPIADASGTMTWTDPSSIITGGLWQSNSPNIYFNTGNVGIGTANPEDKLQVGSGMAKLAVGDAGGNDLGWGTSYIGFNASRQNGSTWSTSGDTHNDGGAIIYGSVAGDILFSTLPTTSGYDRNDIPDASVKKNIRMIIGANGNVGIGTNKLTDNYKLSVDGKVRARSIQVDATNITWWDYVFAKDYQLKSLAEVENYIIQNKHLSNVPSAKEVKEKGINLGDMDAILLKKVEELTLYMIQMNKEIKQLKAENQQLKK